MNRNHRRRLERQMRKAANVMRHLARTWHFDGTWNEVNAKMIMVSRRVHHDSGAIVLFTRDTGHHSSGWMRNPDYERCEHLSLSPIPGRLIVPGCVELDRQIVRMWCEAFFGANVRLLWAESPKSESGRMAGVWHWRLFCDSNWQPILPRGEVYSSELTAAGWKSASEIFELTGVPQPLSTVDPT